VEQGCHLILAWADLLRKTVGLEERSRETCKKVA
jgi:hypothetical protein